MTVEVAAMNRMAVALAADSAVTVSDGTFLKTHDSAIKIFMLSQYHPIGVMVYNNASLLGVPWETIVKLFRHNLGNTSFEKLEQYGQSLISYLDHNIALFPSEVQDLYFLRLLKSEYQSIQNEAKTSLFERIQDDPRKLAKDLTDHFLESVEHAITRRLNYWTKQQTTDCFDGSIGVTIVGRLSGKISDIALGVFKDWPIEARFMQDLREIAVMLVSKNRFRSEGFSGIVIAGFGDREHFPALQHFQVGGIYGGRLKYRLIGTKSISENNPSIVEAYAYTEMVDSFLYGITSGVLDDLVESVVLVRELPRIVVDEIADILPEEQEELKRKVREASDDVADKFSQNVLVKSESRRQRIMQVIETLQLPDLAQVASTLVSLSSFQQRMSFEQETVGGPVDVAVISKGDGFVWIERKHYFREDLNHHFFKNYFHTQKGETGRHARESIKESSNIEDNSG